MFLLNAAFEAANMRIIKPYGRSETEFEAGKNLRRVIRQKSRLDTPNDTPVDIVKFTQNHPELVIAQWISAIDKIATKPKRGKKPTALPAPTPLLPDSEYRGS